TRNPRLFAAKWEAALPLLAYVQATAESSGVPGEFVFLPMVESGYDPSEPGRRGDPAGMWQIMPATARALGLAVNRHYDGRLDPAASTQAVLAMLKDYNDTLHDWRLVDMAFNAGEYKMRNMMSGRDQPATDKPLHLPVSSITRNHLAKLMAMACIVRDPARYAVELPNAENATRLALVKLPQPVRLGQAAHAAEFPLVQLRTLNPGYRSERMPEDAPHHLLLPRENARRLAAVLDSQGAAALASIDASQRSGIDADRRTFAPAAAGAAAN
ncbi:MAG TPA: transglycosylase SLT domain-containing protein, partial [Rhodanobacteraceae bacterium]|nr:transglycosylase SLT domain-containing protein [Rhodanobacteraceae bacterium]